LFHSYTLLRKIFSQLQPSYNPQRADLPAAQVPSATTIQSAMRQRVSVSMSQNLLITNVTMSLVL